MKPSSVCTLISLCCSARHPSGEPNLRFSGGAGVTAVAAQITLIYDGTNQKGVPIPKQITVILVKG